MATAAPLAFVPTEAAAEARPALPRVVLICHSGERIDSQGLASWMAHAFDLVGLVIVRDPRRRTLARARRELRRSGMLGLLDALAFRAYYAAKLAKSDAAWIDREVARLRQQYPADLDAVPRLVASSPNTEDVRRFVETRRPDLMVARSKVLLRREIFDLPAHGTFVLHPGVCPEYRNSHGCFWALVSRDLGRVGVSLLRIDSGIDTGPLYLQAPCRFDEVRESHVVIQHRVVLENLDAIRRVLLAVVGGEGRPIVTEGRASAVWGQPRLSAYIRWKRAARGRAA